MKTQPVLSDAYTLRLQHAILIYGSGRDSLISHRDEDRRVNSVATIHDIGARTDGTPEIEEGRCVSAKEIENLAANLSAMSRGAQWFPPEVIAISMTSIVWWKPRTKRRIWFRTGETDLDALNGRLVHHPALLFMVSGHSLHVMALAGNERPTPATKLYRAPYLNCFSDDGHVQLCGCRPPEYADADNLQVWESVFYDSAFTHGETQRVTALKGGSAALWKAQQTNKIFPASALISAKQTLKEYLS